MKICRFSGALCAILFVVSTFLPTAAQAYVVWFSWTGDTTASNNGNFWTLNGVFSYSNSLIDSGAIDETDLDSFSIEVFLNNVSQGTWDMTQGSTYSVSGILPDGTFNFNYDTSAEAFIVGGARLDAQGQVWNFRGDFGVGFESGSQDQKVSVADVKYEDSSILTGNSTLAVYATSAVPVPPAVYLFATGMLGLVGIARRKRPA